MKKIYRLNPLSIFFKISSGLRFDGGAFCFVLGFRCGERFVLDCRGDDMEGETGKNSCKIDPTPFFLSI